MTVEAAWFGDRAVLVRLGAVREREAVVGHLAGALPGHEVRPGMDAVMVEATEPDASLLARVRAALDAADPTAPALPGRRVTVEVRYDGADLDVVADRLGCSAGGLVAAHVSQAWRVAFVGFAPGFGYLEPLGPPALDWSAVPRRDSPRRRVPAGSVALAAGCSAIYPQAMPGGWMLVGTTSAVLFDPSAQDPALLHPGDEVRFHAVGGAGA